MLQQEDSSEKPPDKLLEPIWAPERSVKYILQ